MNRPSRLLLSLLSLCLLLAVGGCTTETEVAQPQRTHDTQDTQEQSDQNFDALLAYAEAERATIPAFLSQYPDVYESVVVTGSIEEARATLGAPAGIYSTIEFDYTYAARVDWGTYIPGLDSQRAEIDALCTDAIFPAMRQAGITGPLLVVYTYGDGHSPDGGRSPFPAWEHACWSR